MKVLHKVSMWSTATFNLGCVTVVRVDVDAKVEEQRCRRLGMLT